MRIDLNIYASNRRYIVDWYGKSKNKNVSYAISFLAPILHCPCIALAFYISETVGFTVELRRIIDRQIESYGYREILNQPDDSPYLHMDRNHDIKE